MEGKLNAGDAHLAVNYGRLLSQGLRGYEQRTRELKAALDLTDPDSVDKYVFYKSVLIVMDAVHQFALRYAALAAEARCSGDRRERYGVYDGFSCLA